MPQERYQSTSVSWIWRGAWGEREECEGKDLGVSRNSSGLLLNNNISKLPATQPKGNLDKIKPSRSPAESCYLQVHSMMAMLILKSCDDEIHHAAAKSPASPPLICAIIIFVNIWFEWRIVLDHHHKSPRKFDGLMHIHLITTSSHHNKLSPRLITTTNNHVLSITSW